MIIKLDYSNSKPIHINTLVRLNKLLLHTNSTFEKKSHGIQRSFSSKNLFESFLLWKLNRGVHLMVKNTLIYVHRSLISILILYPSKTTTSEN